MTTPDRPLVHRPDSGTEHATAERCHILEIWNDATDASVSVARARVEAGVTTAWHRLRGTTERYLVIAGTGMVEVGGLAPTPVRAGDVVVIPAGVPQRITNAGPLDLVFHAVCTPRFVPEAYEDLEGRSEHGT